MDGIDISSLIYPAIVFVFFWACYTLGLRNKILGIPERVDYREDHATTKSATKRKTKAESNTSAKSQTKSKFRGRIDSIDKVQFTHRYLAGTLKGHTSDVSCCQLSPNGKILASCASDRTVRLWLTKDFIERDHKQIRVNIEFDSASLVRWSPDSKAFVIAKSEDKSIEVYKLGKKEDGSIGNITKAPLKYLQIHKEEIVGLGIACSGKFIMSCTSSGQLVLWDLKGNILEQFTAPSGTTHEAIISRCGRYFGVSGKYDSRNNFIVNEVKFKDDKYIGLSPAYTSTSHKIGIYSFDFNADTSKIVTLDVNGLWKLFDTVGNRMDIVNSGKSDILFKENRPTIRFSHDGKTIIAAIDNNALIYSTHFGNLLLKIEAPHSEFVRNVEFSGDDLFFITCGDRVINVFHNIAGYQENIRDLGNKISSRSIGQALRTRLTEQKTLLQSKLNDLTNA